MDKLTNIILKHKKTVSLVFIGLAIFCAVISSKVSVNYNMMDYLPDDAPSTKALNIMYDQYTEAPPNMRVMIHDVSIAEALLYKEKIANLQGVENVLWLDDSINIYEPLEYADQDTVEAWYKDETAMLSMTVDEEYEVEAVNAIRDIIGDENNMSGTAINNALAPEQTSKEVSRIIYIIVPIVFLILLLTTTSWFEPILFMGTIGVAIALNRGTNLFFGEISFVSNAAGSVLQLAVSMDYSIFLLHRFAEYRDDGYDVTEAMMLAIKNSISSILSSGLTTVTGFIALVIMRFKIGPDMGWVMGKAIVFSLFCVLILLPALTLLTYKLVDKTNHRSFVPPFYKFSKVVMKLKVPVLLVFLTIVIPCYLAQQSNDFLYGATGIYGDESIQIGADAAKINEMFGQSNPIVLMVPKGDLDKEQLLNSELLNADAVTSVISYVNTVGSEVPAEYIPQEQLVKLYSNDYSRFIITLDVVETDEGSFDRVEGIKVIVEKYYGSSYLLAGDMINTSDLKDTVLEDSVKVNMIALISILLILVVTFRSITLPIILILVIESSIWMNLTVPYFTGTTLHYISYLIIGAVQLGATIDYAILLTNRYMDNRREMNQKDAVLNALSTSVVSILTSAGILTLAGIILGKFSSNLVLSQLGDLLGRGAALSFVLVTFVLPQLLFLFDKVIEKTTYKTSFYKNTKPLKIKENNENEYK